jgi:hypothetical protein
VNFISPASAPLLCQGCGITYPPDEESDMICSECAGPLIRVSPEAVGGIGPRTPAVGPEAPGFGFGRFGPNTPDA